MLFYPIVPLGSCTSPLFHVLLVQGAVAEDEVVETTVWPASAKASGETRRLPAPTSSHAALHKCAHSAPVQSSTAPGSPVLVLTPDGTGGRHSRRVGEQPGLGRERAGARPGPSAYARVYWAFFFFFF